MNTGWITRRVDVRSEGEKRRGSLRECWMDGVRVNVSESCARAHERTGMCRGTPLANLLNIGRRRIGYTSIAPLKDGKRERNRQLTCRETEIDG